MIGRAVMVVVMNYVFFMYLEPQIFLKMRDSLYQFGENNGAFFIFAGWLVEWIPKILLLLQSVEFFTDTSSDRSKQINVDLTTKDLQVQLHSKKSKK